jgi:hypothetical protein
MVEMSLDSSDGDDKARCDLGVSATLLNMIHYFALARR